MKLYRVFITSSLLLVCTLNISLSLASTLETQLKEKQAIANTQKAKIKELTDAEKKVRADLQSTEKSMNALEIEISKQQRILSRLQQREKQIAYHIDFLKKQQKKREENIALLLNTLWPIELKQYPTQENDNEYSLYSEERAYIWIQYIMQSIEDEYKTLETEKKQTELALEAQRNNAMEQKKTIDTLKNQLQTLLDVSLTYSKKIQSIREVKQSAEEELKDIVKIIVSIENKLQEKLNIGKITPSTQGKLPKPVIGNIALKYNPKASPPIRGVGFSTAKGAKVYAVADGTIVHNDILRGFGRVIIIAHGNLYYSVYAFLSSAPIAVNKKIKQGETLGTTGFYPAVNSDGLYFELRKNEATINPVLWFKK